MTVLSLVSVEGVEELTNHPVHIHREDGQVNPSSFIPFCSFGGNMTVMGTESPYFEVPVCHAFKEVVLEKQICYEVDLNQYTRGDGKYLDSSLTFLVDTNIERQFSEGGTVQSELGENILDFTSHRSTETQKTMVYIGTLGHCITSQYESRLKVNLGRASEAVRSWSVLADSSEGGEGDARLSLIG